MIPELETVSHRILGVLLNATYQGLLLTALVWMGLKLLPRTNAATRHAVLLATLIVLALLPLGHALMPGFGSPSRQHSGHSSGHLHRPASTPSITPDSASRTSPLVPRGDARHAEALSHLDLAATPHALTFDTTGPLEKVIADPTASPKAQLDAERMDAVPGADPVASVTAGAPSGLGSGVGPIGRRNEALDPPELSLSSGKLTDAGSAPHAKDRPGASWPWTISLVKGIAPALAGVWLLLVMARLAALMRQCLRLMLLKRRGRTAPDPWPLRFNALCDQMRVARMPRLLIGGEVSVPMVVGFLRPAVLLPTSLPGQLENDDMDHILRHELAHVRRRDDWASLIQQVVRAFLFFNPAVWWLCRRLTVEREIACDDHVLAANRAPRNYALFLTEFAGRAQSRDWAPALAVWNIKSQLNERVTMILNTKRNTSPRPARASAGILTTAAALAAVVGLHAAPRMSVASAGTSAETRTVRASADVDPGSGPKPSLALAEVNAAPAPPTPPTPPAPPAPPVQGSARSLIRPDPEPASALRPRKVSDDETLERRLERLERMVESLLERQKAALSNDESEEFDFTLKAPAWDSNLGGIKWKDRAELDRWNAESFSKSVVHEEELARIHREASKAAERAALEAERAAKDQRRFKIEAGGTMRTIEPHHRAVAARQALEARRHDLESQRRSLDKQIESLNRQLEKFEAGHDPVEAESDRELGWRERPDRDAVRDAPESSADPAGPKPKR